jgi:hypothetical protein
VNVNYFTWSNAIFSCRASAWLSITSLQFHYRMKTYNRYIDVAETDQSNVVTWLLDDNIRW